MKNILTMLAAVLLAAPLLAASTCESLVDKNLDKSTSEKVKQCLTEEEQAADDTPKAEVLISETYSVVYPKPKEKQNQKQNQKQTQKQNQKQNNSKQSKEQKIYTPQKVQNEYLDRTTYPSFRNDRLPLINPEEAHDTVLDALKGDKKPTVSKPVKNTKPAAKNNQSTQADNEQPQLSPVEIEANGLQNDPLAQPSDPAVPAGFEDGGVLGPSDFGFNDTDPAFQQ